MNLFDENKINTMAKLMRMTMATIQIISNNLFKFYGGCPSHFDRFNVISFVWRFCDLRILFGFAIQ